MKILFMGTPDFAVPCLERLIADGHEVCAVFSQPDKPKGRGKKLTPPPVKVCALAHGIAVHQPVKMKNGELQPLLEKYDPELIVVVAYGRILPRYVLTYPRRGCINVHGSLLPKYRGSAPLQWAVIRGEKTPGVTTMFMDEGMDTRDILLKREIAIADTDTAAAVYAKLAPLGADLLSQTLADLQAGRLTRIPQDSAQATYAPMLDKTLGNIDFTQSSAAVCALVRGVYPWPCAYTAFPAGVVKVLKALPGRPIAAAPGQIVSLEDERGIEVCCGDQRTVFLSLIQPAGKKAMAAKAYLLGHPLDQSWVFAKAAPKGTTTP